MENRILEAMERLLEDNEHLLETIKNIFSVPIGEDYVPPELEWDIKVNNFEDWKEWYEKIENRENELRETYKADLDRSEQTGKSDYKYIFHDTMMVLKFFHLYDKAYEFWEKSFWWLVDISPKLIHISPKQLFRIEVLKRDKWTCRKCGKHCNSAHHIYSRTYCQSNAPELEWDIRNGVALCFECHKAITEDGKKWFEENKS